MIIPHELALKLRSILERGEQLWEYFNLGVNRLDLAVLEDKMSAADFWAKPKRAQNILEQAKNLRFILEPAERLKKSLEELKAWGELLEDSEEDGEELQDFQEETNRVEKALRSLESRSFLSGKNDKLNAIVNVQAGAGGTESCDWAAMVLRMYQRWAQSKGYKVEDLEIMEGESVGISKASVRLEGLYAYGHAKEECGVHRLVRISPFDSKSRRHTSFCAVDVIAEVDEDFEIDIKSEEIRVDTQRASGAGGQHVNKTESAVRITHLPSRISVYCQSDRSQHKNRAGALRQLKSRLHNLELREKRSEQDQLYSQKGEIAWGNQIRSYVLAPYQLVKDLRTGQQTSNVQAVLDGDLDAFIAASLKSKKKR